MPEMCDRVPSLFVGDVRTSANQFDTASTAEDVRVFEFESSRAARLSRSNVGIARVESCAGKVSQLAEIDGYVFGDREREHNPAVADTRMRRGEVMIQAVEKRRRAADDDRIAVTGIKREAVTVTSKSSVRKTLAMVAAKVLPPPLFGTIAGDQFAGSPQLPSVGPV